MHLKLLLAQEFETLYLPSNISIHLSKIYAI